MILPFMVLCLRFILSTNVKDYHIQRGGIFMRIFLYVFWRPILSAMRGSLLRGMKITKKRNLNTQFKISLKDDIVKTPYPEK